MTHSTALEASAIVRRFYDALGSGRLTLVDAALAPTWTATPPLRTGTGPDGWKASISHLRDVFENLEVIIEDVIVQGDRVAVRTINRGVHRGQLLGVAGTGRSIEFRASDVHRIDQGLIVETWHLEDYFAIAMQLGLTLSEGK